MKPEEPAAPASPSANGCAGDATKETLTAKVNEQGNIVRDLKTKKVSKVFSENLCI